MEKYPTVTISMDSELRQRLRIWAVHNNCSIKKAVHILLEKGMSDI